MTTPAAQLNFIATYLSSKNLSPTQSWLQTFLPTINPNTPLVAVQKSALFRLLATDLTNAIQATPSIVFPAGVSDPAVRELRLPGPIVVQVLDIEDIGRSRWSQVEALEAKERGETMRGREVVRSLPEEATEGGGGQERGGPHKLLLQDAKGTKVYALELTGVEGIGVGMAIGAKLVLRGIVVARGVVMLEGEGGKVDILGGKVDAWDKKWREERKGVLKEKAGMREGG